MVFSIGNDELKKLDNIKKTAKCPKCGKRKKVTNKKMLSFISCKGCGDYLVGINSKKLN